MRTVQMTLDELLVREVDRAAKRLGTTRSGFARDALRAALRQLRVTEQEARHRDGYRRKPVRSRAVALWETEQAWPEDD